MYKKDLRRDDNHIALFYYLLHIEEYKKEVKKQ